LPTHKYLKDRQFCLSFFFVQNSPLEGCPKGGVVIRSGTSDSELAKQWLGLFQQSIFPLSALHGSLLPPACRQAGRG